MSGDIPQHIGSKLGKKPPPEESKTISGTDLMSEELSEEVDKEQILVETSPLEISDLNGIPAPEEKKIITKNRFKKKASRRIKKSKQESLSDNSVEDATEDPITDTENPFLEINSEHYADRTKSAHSPLAKIAIEETEEGLQEELPKNISKMISSHKESANMSKVKKKPESESPKAVENSKKNVTSKKTPSPSSTKSDDPIAKSKKEREEFVAGIRNETTSYLEKLRLEREQRTLEMKKFREQLRKDLAKQAADLKENEIKRQKSTKK